MKIKLWNQHEICVAWNNCLHIEKPFNICMKHVSYALPSYMLPYWEARQRHYIKRTDHLNGSSSTILLLSYDKRKHNFQVLAVFSHAAWKSTVQQIALANANLWPDHSIQDDLTEKNDQPERDVKNLSPSSLAGELGDSYQSVAAQCFVTQVFPRSVPPVDRASGYCKCRLVFILNSFTLARQKY